jgi:arginine repressor
VASILATRYLSGTYYVDLDFSKLRNVLAAAIALLLYDHALSFDQEVTLIWLNTAAGAGNRIGFMINRYLTEAMVVYVSYSKYLCLLF